MIKSCKRFRGCCFLFTSTLIGGIALPLSSSAQDELDEDVFELSPFVITTEEQVGYLATSTLAGTRIKTDLKDLGAAISVVTKELMDDTQSTNVQDLFSNLTGLEVSGAQGNYSHVDFDTPNAFGGISSDAFDLDPQSSVRVRGLERPNFTRGYFSTDIPIDGYNTGSITVSRGANSLLFGLGSAGGVVDNGLNEATIGSNETKFSFSLDNHGSTRSVLNFARTVIDGRLAVRVDALSGDTKYQQDPAHESSDRVYGAFNAVLFENESSRLLGRTTLRGSAEIGSMSTTPPAILLPADGFNSFFEAPSTNHELITGRSLEWGGYDAVKARWKKWALFNNGPVPIGVSNPFNDYWQRIGENHKTNFGGYAHPYVFNRFMISYSDYSGNPGLTDTIQGKTGRTGTNNIINLDGSTDGWWRGYDHASTYDYTARMPNYSTPSMTNRNIFDYRNKLLSGNTKNIDREFDVQNVALEQILFDGKGGLEVAFVNESFERVSQLPFSGNGQFSSEYPIQIDVAQYLPSGEPNPNAGRAFLMDRKNETRVSTTDRESMRATAFYELNFNDYSESRLAKWFGRHRFTGLWQQDDKTGKNHTSALFPGPMNPGDPYPATINIWYGKPGNIHWQNEAVHQVYISDSLIGVEYDDVRLHQAKLNMPQEGDVLTIGMLDNSLVVDGRNGGHPSDNYRELDVKMARYYNSGSIERTKVTSKAFAWQSYLFSDHIVGLFGVRNDEIDTWRKVNLKGNEGRNPGGDINLKKVMQLQDTPETVDGTTTTWSVVGHMPDSWLKKLPAFVSSVSLHYGEGENFSTISKRHDAYNNSLENPSGLTEEVGLTIGLDDSRWMLKINKFKTSASYNGVSGVGNRVVTGLTNSLLNRFQNNSSDDNVGLPFDQQDVAALGFTSWDDVYQRGLIGAIPEPTRNALNYQFNPTTSDFEAQGQMEGITATQDRVSEGWEVELVANPTSNWRVSLNVVQVEATTENSATQAAKFLEEVEANLRANGLWDTPIGAKLGDGAYVDPNLIGSWVDNNVKSGVLNVRAKDGMSNPELREWRVNLINAYDFSGKFKGFGIGGALRYQSKGAVGYRFRLNERNEMIPLVSDPFMGDSLINGDVWLSYKKRLNNKIDWTIQLNVRNAIRDSGNVLVKMNPDGETGIYRNPPEQVFSLRNTFSF